MFIFLFKVIRKLRGDQQKQLIQEELNELVAEASLRSKQSVVSYKDLFTKPKLRRPLILTIVIQLSQVIIPLSHSFKTFIYYLVFIFSNFLE